MTINLKKAPNERQKQNFNIVTALMVFLFIATFTACYWYTIQLENDLKQSQDRLDIKYQEYEQARKEFENMCILRNNVDELKKNITLLKSLSLSNLFIELSSNLPNNMKVNDISVNFSIDPKKPSKLILSGVATEQAGKKSNESISNFIKNVKKSKYVKNATIINSTKNTNYSWMIEIEYDPKIEQNFEYAIGII